MMNVLLAFFLSIAMAISGVASPAELPDTATCWTLSNVKLNLTADDEFAIDPTASLILAAREGRALLQFEVDSAGQTLLPIAAAIDADKLSASFGSGERVYTVSDDDFLKLADADPEDVEAFGLMGELLTNFGGLIGAVRSDPEKASALTKTSMDAIIGASGAQTQPKDIEINGETITVETLSVILDTDMLMGVLDALDAGGMAEIDAILDTLVKIVNMSEGTSYVSFDELPKNGSSEDISIPVTFSYLDSDELSYALVDMASAADDMDVTLQQEWILAGDETQMNYTMQRIPQSTDDPAVDLRVNATFTGPATAPTGIHAEANVRTVQAGSAEGGQQESDMALVLDASKNGELSEGTLDVDITPVTADNDPPAHIDFDWSGSADAYGGTTNAVTLALSARDDVLSLSFDLSHSEVDMPALFDGLQEVPITYEVLEGDEDDPQVQYLGVALLGDVSDLLMDVSTLTQDPSIQALVSFFTSDGDTTGIIGGADGPTDVYVSPDADSEDYDLDAEADADPELSLDDFSDYAA